MDALDLELNKWMTEPFTWETHNCCFLAGRWVAQVVGFDPSESDHFTFDDMGSCQRTTGWFRDPVGTFDKRAVVAGLPRTDTPRRGDVGVIKVPDERHPVAGIFTGQSWAFKTQNGVKSWAPKTVEPLAVWSVNFA